MSELNINPVLGEVTSSFKGGAFSTMYYGRHCGKNLLMLHHDFTVFLIFEDGRQWSSPDFLKAVSFREHRREAIKIVGNGNLVLLLDEDLKLWKLINAFEVSAEEEECLHSLNKDCFYEWVPFLKFRFDKVLALTVFGGGFACLGLCVNSQKKLLLLPSVDSPLEDYTFEELNLTSSLKYYLESFNINEEETLLVTDHLSGKTYMCLKNKTTLISVSNILLISVLHFQEAKCLLLCFENGKLIFHFYSNSQKERVGYLMKKLVFITRCCCFDSCLLWSDGIHLYHTKFQLGEEDTVKLIHLKVNCRVQCPLSILKIQQQILLVTINNFYYLISPGSGKAEEVIQPPVELLSEICSGSRFIEELEKKNELLTYYLTCKEIVKSDKMKQKAQIGWDGNSLTIKTCLGIPLREDFWKVRLMISDNNKKYVKVIDLESDVSQEGYITIENPFKRKCKINVCLWGSFEDEELFLVLGDVDEVEPDREKDELIEGLKTILRERNPYYSKEAEKS